MAALPYIQLYIADYLADTAHLSAAEHGAYLLLIMNYWQRGKPLLNNDDRLAKITRMSLDEWLEIKDTILEFFFEKDGYLYQERVERDLASVHDKCEKASEAGRASAAKRMLNARSTSVQQPFNHKDTDKETDTDTETDKNKAEAPATDLPSYGLADPEKDLWEKGCAEFGEDPDALGLTTERRFVLRAIRSHNLAGGARLLKACQNRARSPAPGQNSITFFTDNKFEAVNRVTLWAQGGPKYNDTGKQGNARHNRDADKGDGSGWDAVIRKIEADVSG